jgi:GNAT superfamily N-acetyltransferase
LVRTENVSKDNLEDVFKVCSYNRPKGPIQEKAKEFKRQWLLDMLEQYGPCTKIAYLDEKPVAQILFYPEEAMSFLHNPRKDVINIKCVFNSYPETRGRGTGAALLRSLVEECHTGLDCIGGRSCRFVVTQPFPHEGELPLDEFYSKYGFKQGHQEMFLEIEGDYTPRDIPEYRPLTEDHGKIILSYNPNCEWGYFFAMNAGELIQGLYPDIPVERYNYWESPEEYKKRPHLPLIAGSMIVNAQVVLGFDFWTDQEEFLRKVEEAMRQ